MRRQLPEGFASLAELLSYYHACESTRSTSPVRRVTDTPPWRSVVYVPSPWIQVGFWFGRNQKDKANVIAWFLELCCKRQAAAASFQEHRHRSPELLRKQFNCPKAIMLWRSPTSPQGERERERVHGETWNHKERERNTWPAPGCSRHPAASR